MLLLIPNDKSGTDRGNPASVEPLPLGRYRFQGSQLTPATDPIPLTREYQVVHSNVQVVGGQSQPTLGVCNGLKAGIFQLPNFEFVTPEHTTMGSPQYPGNYFDLPFLATLDPFPGNPPSNQPAP